MKIQFTILLLTVSSFCLKAQGTWKQKAAFPGQTRDGAVCFTIGNKAYVGPDGVNNDFWEYDPALDKWTRKADFPDSASGRQWAAGFAIRDKGYIGTGAGDFGEILGDFWEYDPQTDKWTRKADIAGKPRAYAAGFAAGGKGYVTTGFDYDTNVPYLWEYDPASDSWRDKGVFPGGLRCFASAVTCGDKAYVGFGTYGSERKDFWEYDQATNTWTRKSDFGGSVRSGAVGFSIGQVTYIGLGSSGIVQNDFWALDPKTDWWNRQTNFPGTARSGAIAFAINGHGYVGLGGGNSDLWEFAPGTVNESQPTAGEKMEIYPTPGTSKINVVYKAVENTRITLNVKNPAGKLIYSENSNPPGGFYQTSVDVKYCPRGEYIAEVIDGERRYAERISLR